ncbi:class I SAM-dependent methyltransferase [Deinococcus sp. SL84]|uniref:class I SAM-dependent methyltransferase n=1 Tax=Deinococcus sp. SL84 TaxID=2994663 RepID=UPI00227528EE|nr:class I SAM-dependent methyltransferase [Deinococcus sp. SL84]MCY1703383.1 class I SAM-dependent methyltransferase [Deinococcus sp. SL84]
MTVHNPFDGGAEAQRYAAGHPYFHPAVLERLRPLLNGHTLGADVACGTGLSSLALAELVNEVRAFDSSEAMLTQAPAHTRIAFAQAPAESLPLPDHCLDVLTVSQAFHWFDRAAFLPEVQRTLKSEGVLFLYDCYFLGEMPQQPDFGGFAEAYFGRYPTPPRHREPFGSSEAAQAGFGFEENHFLLDLPFSLPGLVAYLLTHSNTLAATARGEPEAEIRAWLTEQLSHFFVSPGAERAVRFRAWYAALRPLPV